MPPNTFGGVKIVYRLIIQAIAIFGLMLATAPGAVIAAEDTAELESDSLPQCTELIKECFVSSDSERTNCFFTAATHPFCEGSQLGKLSSKRWSMSPNRPAGFETSPALLGPQLVDQECLANFDNAWSSSLLQGDITNNTVEKMGISLDKCKIEITMDLVRP